MVKYHYDDMSHKNRHRGFQWFLNKLSVLSGGACLNISSDEKCVLAYNEIDTLNAEYLFYDFDFSFEQTNSDCEPILYCIHCNNILKRESFKFQNLFLCENCGWWQVIKGGGGWGLKTCMLHRGILKKYSIDSLNIPLNELRSYLNKHPNDVSFINPTAFEKLIGDVFKDMFDGCEVKHVGGTADRGIDLILVRLEEGTRLIQVKRRANLASTEGVKAVRELNGVLFRDNIPRGMVITTAKRFSKAAINETNVFTQTGEAYDMKLLSFGDVVELFDVKPKIIDMPWFEVFKKENKGW